MKPWETYYRKITPYVPGEQPNVPGMIKLNTNENPYPPAPGVQKAVEELNTEQLKLYPDPTSSLLIKALAEHYKVEENQVFVGVGSDDVLAMAFMSFFNSDKPILFPDITYSFYDVWAELFHIPYTQPPLDEHFRICKEDYYRENGGIVLANPNAPTSICEDLHFIRDILEHNQESVVIVDEAYVDFGGESAISLTKDFENLLIVQTFSKSRSMAGMRIGYAIGNSSLIKVMNDVKYSYNSYTMNLTSLYYGVEAVKDENYHQECVKRIISTRERVMAALKELGFHFPASKANFIFASHNTIPAEKLYQDLRNENIFVRYFNKPKINNYLRITVGTDEEMNQFLEVLKRLVKEN
ncbi:histidinol-phosphate aminotransferase [Anaerocolumna cellulosilytica]|uniref:Histidinol-phosphate aminotransferase n=1 Tax=Anaerocolumna cellulosilytica TaxID=433286 RepID=A0A6S6QYG4_9FIRM|nr:histidinol-phosphate transaminase [Anaerocolumna cellulosilytica]MBB5197846.1 histidinol-phosphate aminotransferase [Anaerocolumna cellulosilytica]BCJ96263.1 histidinol-phosphate aminotransferase [Anaerocolumna cellulosilytica]